MRNPWISMPPSADYVTDEDGPYIEEWNKIHTGHPQYRIDLRLPPEPFLGYHDAPLVVLSANPGLAPDDYEAYQRVGAADRLAEVAKDGGGPFRWLADDVKDLPGGRWWRRCLSGLVKERLSFAELADLILAVEFHGYHTSKWAPLPITLPSQWFGFSLVKQAMDRGAVIVVTRAYREWRVAVPGLASYANLVRTIQVRAASIGPGNIEPERFKLVSAALRGEHSLRQPATPSAPEQADWDRSATP